MLENLSSKDSEKLKTILLKPAEETLDDDVEWAIQKAHQLGSLRETKKLCEQYALASKNRLNQFQSNFTSKMFLELIDFTILKRKK